MLRHSPASVANRDFHVLTRDKFILVPAVVLIEKGIADLDRQFAALRHGVTSVHGEIEDGRLQLDWIGFHLQRAVGPHNIESDGLAEGAAQEIGETGKKPVDAERFWIERLLSRKR